MTSSLSLSRTSLPTWVCILLGLVFIGVGLIVLGDVLAATVISTVLIGVCAIVGGVFEIAHSLWTKGWGGFVWQIFLGILYIIGGLTLVSQPAAGSIILTYVLGIVLVVSGGARVFIGLRASAGWLLALSGLFGILAGLAILSGWPATGLWVIGCLLGIDLVLHGLGWLVLAWRPAQA